MISKHRIEREVAEAAKERTIKKRMERKRPSVMAACSGKITIRPGNSVKGQANMWNLLKRMAGEKELPLCPECGGLPPDSDGPSMGKCSCHNRPKP